MSEKFFDILPPEKSETNKSNPVIELTKKVKIKEPGKIKKRRKGFLFLFLILAVGAYFFVFSKIKIEIYPKFEDFNYKFEVIIDTGVKTTDFTAKIIPGYYLEQEKSISQSFFSSGKSLKSEKARGTVRVYNNYEVSQSLRENTRFMAASGLVFLTPNKIIIPGKKIENGKDVPGFIDISVIASVSGPDYNIEPTTFSLPGLAGTILYTKIYAKSFEPMRGGSAGEVPQLTQEDIQKAEKIVTTKLKEEDRNDIEKKIKESGFVLLEQAFRQNIKDAFSSISAESEADKFDFSVKSVSEALVFKKENMDDLIKDFLKNNLTGNKKVYEKDLIADWKPKNIIFPSTSTVSAGKIILDVEVSGQAYFEIIQSSLKKDIQGKDFSDVKKFLEGKSEISSFKIISWPFWIKKMPLNDNKVDLKINLD